MTLFEVVSCCHSLSTGAVDEVWAPALMLRGIEEYRRGYLFVSRSIWVGSRLQKALEGGARMDAAGGLAKQRARQAAVAPVARRAAAACRAKRDEYATLREDYPTGSAAAGSCATPQARCTHAANAARDREKRPCGS